MTESSSKSLTWATLAAGVASALLLAAIGCLKPFAGRDDGNNLRSGMGPSAQPGAPQQRYMSRESSPFQRERDDDSPALRH